MHNAQYQSLSPTTFKDLVWVVKQNTLYAKHQQTLPLVGAEFKKAAGQYPIAFLHDPDIDQYNPVALLGYQANQNLFVAPDGRWLGNYLPAYLRAYPFALAPHPKTGEYFICADTNSQLILPKEQATSGKTLELFNSQDQPSHELQQMLDFLQQLAGNLKTTQQACRRLNELNLFTPWQPTVMQNTTSLKGLYQIDEAKLNELSPEQLADLRNTGLLTFIYAQLLSTNQITTLETLYQQHQQHNALDKSAQELDLEELFGEEDDDLFKF